MVLPRLAGEWLSKLGWGNFKGVAPVVDSTPLMPARILVELVVKVGSRKRYT
jgi:hypothetical protein